MEQGPAGEEGAAGAWGRLAERLVADVQQQPALLEGGELRDYQMQVSVSRLVLHGGARCMHATCSSYALAPVMLQHLLRRQVGHQL